ncbi:MAG: hypothetical protein O3A93_10510 [Chloroflexi bacterium]|nr:hypothetical protein [Chloroflexota bacterium]MDA1271674.1 hypothetical protein [Chloroflexota bacterium]
MTYLLPEGVPENDNWPDCCIWKHDSRTLNFSWVDANVAGCECPKLDKDFSFLKQQGISALVGVWEQGKSNAPDELKVRRNEIGLFLRKPIEDWAAPSHDQLMSIFAFMDRAISEGQKVVVACGYGEGRTGTILTCYLVWRGMTPFQALRTMIQCQRVPYENREQRDWILSFHPRNGMPNNL